MRVELKQYGDVGVLEFQSGEVLDSYVATLDKVSEQGVTGYLTGHMQPFIGAAMQHFNSEKKTWTGSLMARLFGGGKSAGAAVARIDVQPDLVLSTQLYELWQ